jgi:hypothetical protein
LWGKKGSAAAGFSANAVRFDNIWTALEFVDSDGGHDAFVCRRTGKVYWHFDLAELQLNEIELAD